MALTNTASQATVDAVLRRRHILAREVLNLLRRALPPGGQLEIVLASDAPPERSVAARVVVRGPDALGRLLWPPSADALGEAYLRGDINIEGDIWAAVDAGDRSTSADSDATCRALPASGSNSGVAQRTRPPFDAARASLDGATRGRAT